MWKAQCHQEKKEKLERQENSGFVALKIPLEMHHRVYLSQQRGIFKGTKNS